MFKDIKTTYAPINKKLGVLSLDILSVIVGFIALYFILLFSVFYTSTNYSSNRAYVNETEIALRLNLGDNKEYSDYELLFTIGTDNLKSLHKYNKKDPCIQIFIIKHAPCLVSEPYYFHK